MMCLLTVLCFVQCNYFSSMFGGQWKETDDKCISLEILDSNIDKDGKHAASACGLVSITHIAVSLNVDVERLCSRLTA